MLVNLLKGKKKTPQKHIVFGVISYFEQKLFAHLLDKICKWTCNSSKSETLISYKQGAGKKSIFPKVLK